MDDCFVVVGLGFFDRIQWVVFPRLKPLNATN
jgi:hypothetical protein